jgi:hypothetical protein
MQFIDVIIHCASTVAEFDAGMKAEIETGFLQYQLDRALLEFAVY